MDCYPRKMSFKPDLPPKPNVVAKPSMLPKPKKNIKPVPIGKATKPSLPPKPKSDKFSKSLPTDIKSNSPVKNKPSLPPKVQVYRKAMLLPKPNTQTEKSNMSHIFNTISNSTVPSSKYRSLPYARDVVKYNIVRSHSMAQICRVTTLHKAIPVCDIVVEEEVTPICDAAPKEEVAWIRQRVSTEEATMICDTLPIEEVIPICDMAPMHSGSLTRETALTLETILKCHIPQTQEVTSTQITSLKELVPTLNMKTSESAEPQIEVKQTVLLPKETISSIHGIIPKPSTIIEKAVIQTKEIRDSEFTSINEKMPIQEAPVSEKDEITEIEVRQTEKISSNADVVKQNVEKDSKETVAKMLSTNIITPVIEILSIQEAPEMETNLQIRQLQEVVIENKLLQAEEILHTKPKSQQIIQKQNTTQEPKTETQLEELETTERITHIQEKLAQDILGMQDMLFEHKTMPQKEAHVLHTMDYTQPDASSAQHLTKIQKLIEKQVTELPEEILKIENDIAEENETLMQELVQTVEVEVMNNGLGTVLQGTLVTVPVEGEAEEKEITTAVKQVPNTTNILPVLLSPKKEMCPDIDLEPIENIRSIQRIMLEPEIPQILATTQSQEEVLILSHKVITTKELQTAQDETLDTIQNIIEQDNIDKKSTEMLHTLTSSKKQET
ncbi:hypothetical protein C0J52_04755 [Blattella germanica]|nr:hypothetical protein C0J52_04755 [Blattella germanica]